MEMKLLQKHNLGYVGTIYTHKLLSGEIQVLDSNEELIGMVKSDLIYDVLLKVKDYDSFEYFLRFFFENANDDKIIYYGNHSRKQVLNFIKKQVSPKEDVTKQLIDKVNTENVRQVGKYSFIINYIELVNQLKADFGVYKPIYVKALNGVFYYEESEDFYKLYDENDESIINFDDEEIIEKLKNICHISELANFLVNNVMWADSICGLHLQYLDYIEKTKEEYSLEHFLDDVEINYVGNVYFIFDYDEF